MTTNPQTFAYEPPPARQILEQHGVPEDVIDGVLAVHAQELAAIQRAHADQVQRHSGDDQLSASAVTGMRAVADVIDPTHSEQTTAVPSAPVDRAAVLAEAADKLDRYVGKQSSDAAPEVEGARLVIRELRRLADEEQPEKPDRCPHGCDTSTCPCLACEADEEQQPETQAAADLPARLEAVLTERFTELGNPFSEMRRHEQGPDGWPASHSVGPHQVAEVLRELLATDAPAAVAQPGKEG